MNEQASNLNSSFGNIDQIREILFGSQLQSFSDRLNTLEGAVKTLQADTDRRFREIQESSNNRIDKVQQALSAELQNAISSLSAEIKALGDRDAQEIGETRQNLDRLSKRLSANVATLDETIDKQARSLRDDLLSSHRKLQSELLNLREQLFEDFEKRMNSLTSAKISREDMADLFFELVLKLKGTDFVPPWKEGEAKAGYFLPEDKTEA
jgi:exonuclease VII large subunit